MIWWPRATDSYRLAGTVRRKPDRLPQLLGAQSEGKQLACKNGIMSVAVVNRMLVITGQPTVVHAATNMGLFTYREDGNDCWKKHTAGLPASGNAIDLVIDPFRNAIYVAFSGQGIFKLTPGQPWIKINYAQLKMRWRPESPLWTKVGLTPKTV